MPSLISSVILFTTNVLCILPYLKKVLKSIHPSSIFVIFISFPSLIIVTYFVYVIVRPLDTSAVKFQISNLKIKFSWVQIFNFWKFENI